MPDATVRGPDPQEVIVGGKYRVIRLLGRGGMGGVYEAENTWTKRRVALKVMSPSVSGDPRFVGRFMQEAQTAARLSHPNIVDVLDMGQDQDTREIYIVQELLAGHDLGRHLAARGRLPADEAIGLLVPVMEALVMAHGRGVVHRDLKPDNIFLAETPRGVVPTLIDFGIAKVTTEGAVMQRTGTGMLLGTAYYMSPEQARGDTALDARSDVWSLGVVLYELLSGCRPFEAANGNALIAKIIYETPKPLDIAAPDLPPELVDAVMRAVQPDLSKRHPSMQAFLDALCAIDGHAAPHASLAPVADPSPSTPSNAPRISAPSGQTFAPVATITRSRPRGRTATIAAGAFALVVLAVVAVSSRGARAPTRAPLLVSTPVTPVAVRVVEPAVIPTPPAPVPAPSPTAVVAMALADAGQALVRVAAPRSPTARPVAPPSPVVRPVARPRPGARRPPPPATIPLD